MKYPKKKEKPPFQTWTPIECTIARAGLSAEEARSFWDCLFLDVKQIAEVLEHVRAKETRRTYFYPLLVCIAHTGHGFRNACGRKSQVRLREKKKDQGTETYRYVTMTGFLKDTMKTLLENGHPGGRYSFCRFENKKFHDQTLHDDFEWFMAGSKWSVLRGFHVFRHSFASNPAREGVDQRVIDDLLGHQTEAMRKRYRHMYPEQKQNAVGRLFG